MDRKASVVWEGGIKDGKGSVTTSSGVLSNAEYSFGTRFEGRGGGGTNPEELIAAAHASCFSMALSAQLGKLGLKAERINTTGTVTIEKVGEDWTVTAVHLDTVAFIPGADQAIFDKAAHAAKVGCPISRLLKAPTSLAAKLESRSFEEKKVG
jgi:osmotically inducible protein OsmC